MKNKSLIIGFVIGIALLAGFVVRMQKNEASHAGHAAADLYYCPMHPKVTSDRPGTCPICHMSLVKMEEHPSEEHALQEHLAGGVTHADVPLTPHQQQLIGVRTQKVERKPLQKTIRAYGYVTHDLELYEKQLEYIYAWWDFYAFSTRRRVVDEFKWDWREYWKNPSTRPRSDEFLKAQERLIKAEYELRHMGLTSLQLEELRKVKYGQPWVQPEILFFGEKGFHFSVWVYADIFEQDIGFVTVGQPVTVEIPAFRETHKGVIRVVGQVVDPVTRTVRVRIELPEIRSELAANMLANVMIESELNEGPLVPESAVILTGERAVVFVQKSPGVFEPVTIKAGYFGNGYYLVNEGLKGGETIAVDGMFLLDSESRLNAVFNEASGGGHRHE